VLTQIVTFLIFVAIIGCILYGRKLIRTEKVDAVFGNPERAKGGVHWVIVGSSAILLTWLYYSWDIAKGFYPQSANELCQVAKVNDSLLGLKYQFPITERQFKSTYQIKNENENLELVKIDIQNSTLLNNQEKNQLINFANSTINLVPLLTNEDLMEIDTKRQIDEITEEIKFLTSNFIKPDYPLSLHWLIKELN
jgi:taurine transport system permease protein